MQQRASFPYAMFAVFAEKPEFIFQACILQGQNTACSIHGRPIICVSKYLHIDGYTGGIFMAPRSTPFNIVVHFSGKKTNAEISRVVHKFYLDEIKNRLIESHLEDYEKQEVLERLIDRFSTPMNDTFNESK